MINIINRAHAISENKKHYFTGKPCKHGHVAKRSVVDRKCVQCALDISSRYRKNNLEKIHNRNVQAYKDNPARFNEYSRSNYARNKENYKENALEYRERHREQARKTSNDYYHKYTEKCKKVNREYNKNNRGRCNALEAKRHARKMQATPTWANQELIVLIYERCRELTLTSGIKYNVDHIVPLQGDFVCGLHCEDNLQVITRDENLKKGNKHEHI